MQSGNIYPIKTECLGENDCIRLHVLVSEDQRFGCGEVGSLEARGEVHRLCGGAVELDNLQTTLQCDKESSLVMNGEYLTRLPDLSVPLVQRTLSTCSNGILSPRHVDVDSSHASTS